MKHAAHGKRTDSIVSNLLPTKSEAAVKPLYEDEFWDVSIEWKLPTEYSRLLVDGSKHDGSAHLYMISARFAKSPPKGKYIGKTWHQDVSTRLKQPDHKKRFAAFKGVHPDHRFYVSHGILSISNGNLTNNRLAEIEKILIYANDPDHSGNVKNFYEHGVNGSYAIENTGYRCALPRKIQLGVFAHY